MCVINQYNVFFVVTTSINYFFAFLTQCIIMIMNRNKERQKIISYGGGENQ